ncbi:MAG: mechanosensitive ion channel domain-containing protein [Actinomycetota bacterium]
MRFLAQVPSVEELDQALNTDQLTAWDFVGAALSVLAAFIAASVVRRILKKTLAKVPGLTDEARLLISRAVGWVIILVGVVYAVDLLGFEMGPALFAVLVLLVVVFLAGRGLMENFAAGVVLQGTPMFAPGDLVEFEGGVGTVKEITGRNVVIATVDGKRIYIPNTTVVNEVVTNYVQNEARRATLIVGVAYGTDLDLAKRVLETTTAECAEVHDAPLPEALATEFADNSVDFRVRFWTDPLLGDEELATDTVARAIDRAFKEHDIEIPVPQRTLWWGEAGADDRTGEQ